MYQSVAEAFRPALHFVGFRDDRYTFAVRVFGEPDFIHRGFDKRALREIADVDTVVFADGPHDQEPRAKSFTDIHDGSEPGSPFVGSSSSLAARSASGIEEGCREDLGIGQREVGNG